jgi:hypothetical protein
MAKSTTTKKSSTTKKSAEKKSDTTEKKSVKKAEPKKAKGFDEKAKDKLTKIATSRKYTMGQLSDIAQMVLGDCTIDACSNKQVAFVKDGDRCPKKGYFTVG